MGDTEVQVGVIFGRNIGVYSHKLATICHSNGDEQAASPHAASS